MAKVERNAGTAAADFAGKVKAPLGIRLKASDIRVRAERDTAAPLKTSRLGEVLEELKKTMWNNVGIIRSDASLQKALKDIDLLTSASDEHGMIRRDLEMVNMLTTARLIVSSALRRKESVGTHYREDFPEWSGKKRHLRVREDY